MRQEENSHTLHRNTSVIKFFFFQANLQLISGRFCGFVNTYYLQIFEWNEKVKKTISQF